MKRTGLHLGCEAEACTIMDRSSTISRLSEEEATASSSMAAQPELGPQEARVRHKPISPLSGRAGLLTNQRSQLDTHADWGYHIRIPRALRIRPTAAASNTLAHFIKEATTRKFMLSTVMETAEVEALLCANGGEALVHKIRQLLLKLLPAASTVFQLLDNGSPMEWSAALLHMVLVYTSARAPLLNQDMVGDVPFETLRSVVLQAHGNQPGGKPQNCGRFDCVVGLLN